MRIRNNSKARVLRDQLFETDADGKHTRLKDDQVRLFEEACKTGRIKLSDYSIRDLAEAFHGEGWADSIQGQVLGLREAGTPVTSTIFPQITSQLIFSEVRSQFDVEANVFTPLIPTIPSDIKGTEIVPSITNIDPSDVQAVAEGTEYPSAGVLEEYFTVAAKTKRGLKIELTREAIRLDRTNMLVEQARKVGAAMGADKENRVIDTLIGQTNNYSRNGTATNTYLTAGAYINNQSGTPLNDWTDIDNARQLFVDILDPNTSEPITITPRHLIVMPFKQMTAARILNATSVRTIENAAAGTRSEDTISPNPLTGMGLQILSSDRLYRRVLAGPEPTAATARDGWFLGDLERLLAYYEIWPLQVFMQGPEHTPGFDRDVEMKFKVTEFGVAQVREPRYMLRLENTAW